MPDILGVGRAVTYITDAMGGTAEKAAARVSAKAETQAGRKHLKKLANTKAGRRAGESKQVQRQAYNASVGNGARANVSMGRVDYPSYFRSDTGQGTMMSSAEQSKRRQRAALAASPGPSFVQGKRVRERVVPGAGTGPRRSDPAFVARYKENKFRERAAVAMRRETGVRRASLAVGLGGVGVISGKGPNESRTSYRGPRRTPGLRNSVGTGRYA